jgi:hypothetical protein
MENNFENSSAMNKKLPFVPNETDAILYVIISVLLLMSVNQVLSHPQIREDVSYVQETCPALRSQFTAEPEKLCGLKKIGDSNLSQVVSRPPRALFTDANNNVLCVTVEPSSATGFASAAASICSNVQSSDVFAVRYRESDGDMFDASNNK